MTLLNIFRSDPQYWGGGGGNKSVCENEFGIGTSVEATIGQLDV